MRSSLLAHFLVEFLFQASEETPFLTLSLDLLVRDNSYSSG